MLVDSRTTIQCKSDCDLQADEEMREKLPLKREKAREREKSFVICILDGKDGVIILKSSYFCSYENCISHLGNGYFIIFQVLIGRKTIKIMIKRLFIQKC